MKDLSASKAFYKQLGFEPFGGDDKRWLILKNGDHLIGLFEGMFEKNILTFNPGWDQDAKPLEEFTDVRELHKALKAAGVETEQESLQPSSGPGSFVMVDPDGNPILIDQHR